MEIRLKLRPGERQRHLARSLSSTELGWFDPGCYRMTPPGAPDVPAFIRPGIVIRTSYGTGGIVIEIEGPFVHIAPDRSEYPHFTLVYVPADRFGRHSKLDRHWINECVAVDGRILKLLGANGDEVFVGIGPAGPP
jgi:hypothetical protein